MSINSSFAPLLISTNCESPFKSPLRSVQPRWTRVQNLCSASPSSSLTKSLLSNANGSPSINRTNDYLLKNAFSPSKNGINACSNSGFAPEKDSASDRFIPNRSLINAPVVEYRLGNCSEAVGVSKASTEASASSSNYSTSDSNGFENPNNSSADDLRVLSFTVKAPESKIDSAAIYAKVKYPFVSRRCGITTAKSLPAIPNRTIPSIPFKVLDAPGLIDDYYLNLMHWSSQNVLAIALSNSIYVWNASSGSVNELSDGVEMGLNCYFSSVSFSQDGSYLATGSSDGQIHIWDVETNQRLRVMSGNNCEDVQRIGSLAWNGASLTNGSRSGLIMNHDTRIRNHVTSTWTNHSQEVCGLEWDRDGTFLASGGNDNVVNIWDGRNASPLHSFTQHQAAVKAIGWCPWQPHLLASGGGSTDKCIKFWNAATGSLLNSVDTGSQVCALKWSANSRELVSSHGFADNQLIVWRYPSMTPLAKINAHSSRVLYLASSPDGQTVASASGDETIKFWNIFEKGASGSGSFSAKSAVLLSGSSGAGFSASGSLAASSGEDTSLFVGKPHSPLSKVVDQSNFKRLKIR